MDTGIHKITKLALGRHVGPEAYRIMGRGAASAARLQGEGSHER